ncbi:MAG: heme A synthase [Pseudomonadota bacterium]
MAHRSIFEEVDTAKAAAPKPQGGLIDRATAGARGAIRAWLMALFALVVIMIAVGGLTRLTDSGLSITEWAPITGAIPPLNAEDWQAEFDLYRQIPEYQLQNAGMSLAEFKVIYWWEWGHRQLGRVIGLVWALGFFGFLVARKIPAGWTPRLLLLGGLGGLQGAIGWWMVSSGLTGTMLDVASYRLATHLGLAFVILGLILWYILKLKPSSAELLEMRRSRDHVLSRLAGVVLLIAFAQILLGALVAGIDAGRSYTDWPLYAGQMLPPTAFDLAPVWRNFFEEAGLVQFNHRNLGYVLFLVGIAVWLRARRSASKHIRTAFLAIVLMMSVQMLLGIMTVLYAAPWPLAILHQFFAVVLVGLILNARFQALYPRAQSVRSGAGRA